jgi:ATP-dependent DNA helicase RecG
MLRDINIVPLLISESMSHGQIDAIRRGEAHVVFGTRRILASDIHWRRLGLVICEERGEYGTVMPGLLPHGKGPRPDLLVTTAAPIPSSLAFTVFGEFDVSVVPVNHSMRAAGNIFEANERTDAYASAREQVAAGRQAFVVFPVRDGKDLLSVSDALRMAKALQAEAFPEKRIGIYCSGMTRDERFRVFDDFQQRRIDVLVCTTYIEEAPSLDNATVLVVEYADLHDMVRLHRLRGHISRGPRAGTGLYILSDAPDEKSRALIEQVIREEDGFRLAELDLQVRGSRALLGDRAEELPEFVWADPPRDRQLLLKARAEAFSLIRQSNSLRRWPDLVAAIQERWGDWFGDTLPSPTPSPARPGGARRRRRRRRRRK